VIDVVVNVELSLRREKRESRIFCRLEFIVNFELKDPTFKSYITGFRHLGVCVSLLALLPRRCAVYGQMKKGENFLVFELKVSPFSG